LSDGNEEIIKSRNNGIAVPAQYNTWLYSTHTQPAISAPIEMSSGACRRVSLLLAPDEMTIFQLFLMRFITSRKKMFYHPVYRKNYYIIEFPTLKRKNTFH
jgi:hypothetical protein